MYEPLVREVQHTKGYLVTVAQQELGYLSITMDLIRTTEGEKWGESYMEWKPRTVN